MGLTIAVIKYYAIVCLTIQPNHQQTTTYLNVFGVAPALGEVDVVDGGDAEPLAGQVAKDSVTCRSYGLLQYFILGSTINYILTEITGGFKYRVTHLVSNNLPLLEGH